MNVADPTAANAYERGRQDFAQEAIDDLAERGFSIALWQPYTRSDICRWLKGLRDGEKWHYEETPQYSDWHRNSAPPFVYVEGWRMGLLEARLKYDKPPGWTEPIHVMSISQANMIAKQYGYSIKFETIGDAWVQIELWAIDEGESK